MAIVNAAIPIFFVLIALELIVARVLKRHREVYSVADSIADLSCGVLQQLTGLGMKFLSVSLYIVFAEYLSVQALFGAPEWPNRLPFLEAENTLGFTADWPALATWVFCFIAYDFIYYWAHRMMHQTNFGWATHVPHHSSEEYNLTVALRQSSLQVLFSAWFGLPLAFIGLPWEVLLPVAAINLIYQFWIHTRLVGKLPRWVEFIFNTPSHHRVHHGRNPKYIDRNHAGVFIIWDRMFGTFKEEEEEPVYGITSPLRTYNPVVANTHFFRWIGQQLRGVRSVKDALWVLFGKPGWRPSYLGGPILPTDVDKTAYRKWEVPSSTWLKLYALLHFALSVPIAFYALLNNQTLPTVQLVGLGFVVTIALVNISGILEHERWAWGLEIARLGMLVALAVAAGVLGYTSWPISVGIVAFLLLSAAAIWYLRHEIRNRATAQLAL